MFVNDPRPANDTVYKIQVCSRGSLPHMQGDLIEHCAMRQFADMCANNDCSGDEVFIGFVDCADSDNQRPQDVFLYSGKGGEHSDVKTVLSDFADKLLSKLPCVNPPERAGPDGKPIEDTIELADATKSFSAQPRRLSQDEDSKLQKVLKDLLENGQIVSSFSSHAAPIVSARKKPDPVPGRWGTFWAGLGGGAM